MNSSNPANPTNPSDPAFLLTIDVEDWFQVENFKQCIPFSSWPSCELRVEKNTNRLLDLFDSQNGQRTTDNGPDEKVNATFFVLGWIAERLPHLVREIHSRGHEVASHGYRHNLCNEESGKDLKTDLSDSKKLLEDLIGVPVFGYRAPSFSIDDDILKTIEDCGYLYDSSYNSFAMHDRYGHVTLSDNGRRGIAFQLSNAFYEIPISNIDFAGHILPWGGGAYFRLAPFFVFKKGIQSILRKEKTYLLYMHPWEIDPEQPKVREASRSYRFRHYVNLGKTHSRLAKLLETFSQYSFLTCTQYINELSR